MNYSLPQLFVLAFVMTASSQTWSAPVPTLLAQAKKALDDAYKKTFFPKSSYKSLPIWRSAIADVKAFVFKNDKELMPTFDELYKYNIIILNLMQDINPGKKHTPEETSRGKLKELIKYKKDLFEMLKKRRSAWLISSKKGDALELLIAFNSYLISLCSKTATTFAQEEEAQLTEKINKAVAERIAQEREVKSNIGLVPNLMDKPIPNLTERSLL
jgi:hypothetical protein